MSNETGKQGLRRRDFFQELDTRLHHFTKGLREFHYITHLSPFLMFFTHLRLIVVAYDLDTGLWESLGGGFPGSSPAVQITAMAALEKTGE